MMAESRWIKTSLFLMLVLQFTAAENRPDSFTVREGQAVTLPCNNVREGEHECRSTTWLFIRTSSRSPVVVVSDGQLGERVKAQSDRLSVTHNCSLVIKKLNQDDVGYYECRQSTGGKDARVFLSVVTMTEVNITDLVKLHCSVTAYNRKYKVKWLFQGQDIDKDNKDVRTSLADCSSSVTFLRSNYIYASRSKLLTCKVTDDDSEHLFYINPPQLSGEDTTTTTTTTTESTTTNRADVWWLYVVVAVGLLAVLIITVAVVRWKRRKGNVQNNLAPATCVPETTQDMADPYDSVCYISIIHTKETNSKAQVLCRNDAESEAVTYSAVKASSADPTSLYATVN